MYEAAIEAPTCWETVRLKISWGGMLKYVTYCATLMTYLDSSGDDTWLLGAALHGMGLAGGSNAIRKDSHRLGESS